MNPGITHFRCLLIVIANLFLIFTVEPAFADDWRQWMGPGRDGVYHESGVIESIPDEGLKVKWRTPVGGGYAGPAVADGRVFLFDYLKQDGEAFNNPGKRANLQGLERLLVLDEKNRKETLGTPLRLPLQHLISCRAPLHAYG